MMNALPKYVVSRQLERTSWQNAHTLGEDFAENIRAMKSRPGQDIALFAGGEIASSFIKHKLVDEYRLIINPLLQGRGTPLFTSGYDRTNLRLLKTRTFKTGAIVAYYEPAKD